MGEGGGKRGRTMGITANQGGVITRAFSRVLPSVLYDDVESARVRRQVKAGTLKTLII